MRSYRFSFVLVAAWLVWVPTASCTEFEAAQIAGQDAANQRVDLRSLKVNDLEGVPKLMFAASNPHGVGLVFLSTECPIARRYLPELGRLANEFEEKGVPVFGVLSDRSISRTDAKAWNAEFKVSFPVLFDASGELAACLKPTHTPEAFVISPKGETLYRGRIDDFFGQVGRSRQQANEREFFDALTSVAQGHPPRIRYAKPVGCPIENIKTVASRGEVTYCRDVAPILFNNCTGCHHQGAAAPFPLMNYEDASRRAGWLAEVTATKVMPPWNAKPGFGHFKGERVLSKAEVATFAAWAEAGAPYGDADDLPKLPEFSNEWTLGKPDLIVRMPKPITIPADGPDVFRSIPIPLNYSAERSVKAIEFRPGNPRVVHHAIVMTGSSAFLRDFAPATEMPGFDPVVDGLPRFLKLAKAVRGNGNSLDFNLLGGWVPGMQTYPFPDNAGLRLGKDSTLLLQMHYYPSGKAETDQSEVGIYFSDRPAKQIASGFGLNILNLDIPPGEKRHRVSTSLTLPVDVTLFGINPHMHLLGREMKVTATKPNGEVEKLIWIDKWDWNWQGQYRYQTPLKLPKGTRFDLVALYDNSKDNPANPHSPPKRVRFGRKTTDEMCLCFLQVTLEKPEDQQRLRQAALANVARQFGNRFGEILRRLE